VLELLDATGDDAERRALAELNEGVTHPTPKPLQGTTAHEAHVPRAHDEAPSPLPPSPALPVTGDAFAAPSS
jgi:hypothetical protein